MHGAFLTPQESGDEKTKKNCMQRGETSKKREGGTFSQTKWVPKNSFDDCYYAV